ncbi:Aim21p LALA0_S01e09274g [Lachancea lanzarotensis]|uniref:LALA0S01e09274g1_1 n=1 Tax=Lachancea lanzarotensis TaxID=1245769 RepID=A0A0C7MSU1_9SACH|nr:uncharacterized protein LALA0_S01e09274g [Lachancea lanzarotensis]CEP60374.1 LALA0S01e09274g1_1 [Lachancea lanzarotensis]
MSSDGKTEDSTVPVVPSRPTKRSEGLQENKLPVIPTSRPLRNRTTGFLNELAPKIPSTRPIRRHTEEFDVKLDDNGEKEDVQPPSETGQNAVIEEMSRKVSQDFPRNEDQPDDTINESNETIGSKSEKTPLPSQIELSKTNSSGLEVDNETIPAVDEVSTSIGESKPADNHFTPEFEGKVWTNVTTPTISSNSVNVEADTQRSENPKSPKNNVASSPGEEAMKDTSAKVGAPIEKTDRNVSKEPIPFHLGKTETTTLIEDEAVISGKEHLKEISKTPDLSPEVLNGEEPLSVAAQPTIGSSDIVSSSPPKEQPILTPKIPERPAKRAPPKKPSSKIAAFQEMLKQQQLQDQTKSRGGEGNGQPLHDRRAKVASNLNGIFGLPNMGGGLVPIPQSVAPQKENEISKAPVTSSSSSTEKRVEPTAQRRAKGPRGRKLPTHLAGVEKVESKGSPYEIQVVKAWSLSFQAKVTEPIQVPIAENTREGGPEDGEVPDTPASGLKAAVIGQKVCIPDEISAVAKIDAESSDDKPNIEDGSLSSKGDDVDATYDIVNDLLEDDEQRSSISGGEDTQTLNRNIEQRKSETRIGENLNDLLE